MTSLTIKDIETVVLRALGSEVKIVNHSLEPFSKLKTGCLGAHLLLTIRFKRGSNNCEESQTFFVKTMPDSQIILDTLMDDSMFTDEANFYENITPLLMKEYNADKWSPRCYLITSNALVFEDLRVKGYTISPDPFLDEILLKATLTSLAQFHASTILAEHRLGKTLKEIFPNAFVEKILTNHGNFAKMTPVGFDAIKKMIEKYGMDPSFMPKIKDRVWEFSKIRKGKCNVLCHGDLWKNNLMFKSNGNVKCVMVDYQFLRYTSPCIDVSTLVYLHTTPEYRKKSELNLFEHYYCVLRDTLLQGSIKPPIPSYESMLQDYKDYKLIGMIFGLLYLPALYLPSDVLEKILNIPEEMKSWFLGNRFEVISFYLDTDPSYEKKLKNMIVELMEEAKIVFNA